MELEGLKRAFAKIEDNVLYKILVTDRHGPVRKYMRTEKKGKKHYFDVFHVAKCKYIIQSPLLMNGKVRIWLHVVSLLPDIVCECHENSTIFIENFQFQKVVSYI